MKLDTDKIVSTMSNLRKALTPLLKKKQHVNMLAFNLGDIKEELKVVYNVLDKVDKTGKISEKDFWKVVHLVGIHWPFHVKNIGRLALKMDCEPEKYLKETK